MSTPVLITVGLAALVLLIIAEWTLLMTWNRAYFTVGLPIFTRRIPGAAASSAAPQLAALQTRFGDRFFRELGPEKYGFFERVGTRSAPWTHGLIIFDPVEKQVLVKGFINWYAVWVFVPALYGAFWLTRSGGTGASLLCFPGELIFMGLLYAVERSDYASIAAFAAEAWQGPSTAGHPGT